MRRAMAVAYVMAVATEAAAEPPQSRIATPTVELPPHVLTGLGAGPAWPSVSDCPYGQHCDLPVGLGLRGWAWAPLVDGFAMGAVVDHLRVPWTFERTSSFTFAGGGFSFGSGYSPRLALALWVALGKGFSSAAGQCVGSSSLGAELGARVDSRVARRLRAGVSISVTGRGAFGGCSGASAGSNVVGAPITSQTFLSADFTYEWLRGG